MCWAEEVQGTNGCFSEELKMLNKPLLDWHRLCPHHLWMLHLYYSILYHQHQAGHWWIVIKSNIKSVIPLRKERRKKRRKGRKRKEWKEGKKEQSMGNLSAVYWQFSLSLTRHMVGAHFLTLLKAGTCLAYRIWQMKHVTFWWPNLRSKVWFFQPWQAALSQMAKAASLADSKASMAPRQPSKDIRFCVSKK